MSSILKSVCWAMAMLVVAAGIRFGLMDRSAGTTILFILPVLAILSLRPDRRAYCGRAA